MLCESVVETNGQSDLGWFCEQRISMVIYEDVFIGTESCEVEHETIGMSRYKVCYLEAAFGLQVRVIGD